MNKKIITVVVALILIAAAFYSGMVYGQGKSTTPQGARTGNFMLNQNDRAGNGRAAGGFAGGEIISKDSTGVIIKMQNGSSKIILISGTTSVLKTVPGTPSDLGVGTQITVNGNANTDGSITAESIQVRQATSTSPLRQ